MAGKSLHIVLYHEPYRELVKLYRSHLEMLGYHPRKSALSRSRYVKEFLQRMEQAGIVEIEQITGVHIQTHYEYLQSRPSVKDGSALSSKTVYDHMLNVQMFFDMLQSQGSIVVHPANTLRIPYGDSKEERAILTQAEIKILYESTISEQEKAILALAYGCGLRASEVQSCNIEDIRLREGILVVPRGKGNKRRVVPMSKGVITDLTNYFYQERPQLTTGRNYHPGEKAFLLNIRGARMMAQTCNKYLRRIIKRSEDKIIQSRQISLHCLRHSIATHLIEQGMELEHVREFLGHNHLETTEVYTRVSQTQLKNLVA